MIERMLLDVIILQNEYKEFNVKKRILISIKESIFLNNIFVK